MLPDPVLTVEEVTLSEDVRRILRASQPLRTPRQGVGACASAFHHRWGAGHHIRA